MEQPSVTNHSTCSLLSAICCPSHMSICSWLIVADKCEIVVRLFSFTLGILFGRCKWLIFCFVYDLHGNIIETVIVRLWFCLFLPKLKVKSRDSGMRCVTDWLLLLKIGCRRSETFYAGLFFLLVVGRTDYLHTGTAHCNEIFYNLQNFKCTQSRCLES